jgi:hypothetical protein
LDFYRSPLTDSELQYFPRVYEACGSQPTATESNKERTTSVLIVLDRYCMSLSVWRCGTVSDVSVSQHQPDWRTEQGEEQMDVHVRLLPQFLNISLPRFMNLSVIPSLAAAAMEHATRCWAAHSHFIAGFLCMPIALGAGARASLPASYPTG